MSANAPLPLDDLVVVELGDSIAAAWTGRLLADLGAQAQYACGLSAFTGIMAAVTWRDSSSVGQLIDVSMLETLAFIEWKSGTYFEADGRVRYRVGNRSHWLVLAAIDGYIALVYQDDNFKGL